MQVKTRFPRWAPSAWLRPIMVVLFPSPNGVGVMAVTSMYFPLGRFASRVRISSRTFASCRPCNSNSEERMPASWATSVIGLILASWAISISEGTGRRKFSRVDFNGGVFVVLDLAAADLRTLGFVVCFVVRFDVDLARAVGMGVSLQRIRTCRTMAGRSLPSSGHTQGAHPGCTPRGHPKGCRPPRAGRSSYQSRRALRRGQETSLSPGGAGGHQEPRTKTCA